MIEYMIYGYIYIYICVCVVCLPIATFLLRPIPVFHMFKSLRDLTLSKICSLTSAPTLGETGVDAISGKGS